MRKLKSLRTPFFLAALILIPAAFLPARAGAGTIHYAAVEGIVNPVQAEFIIKTVKRASDESAEAVVLQIDTPGGLDLSMRDIVKTILSSEVPVVVYVAPAGSRAASAGVFITYAAHAAAMSPGTNIGSAHPVMMGAGGSEKMDDEIKKKIENDAVAYLRGIAGKRGRNAEWAEQAVRQSVNITAEEALRLRVIDILAPSREELFKKLDGMRVETAGGARVLRTKDADVKEVEMNLRYRLLNVITNPNVAYILMMIGLTGLYFELSNPGLILPGVVGAVSLVLAFYAFQTLPINYAGLLLIALGVFFFVLEIKIVSYGLLSIAGIISLVLGSMLLFDTTLPFMKVSFSVMLPMILFVAGILVFTMYWAASIHKRRPVSGAEGFKDKIGKAVTNIDTADGKVFVEGEYWSAVSDAPIKEGESIKVISLDGMTLKVTKA